MYVFLSSNLLISLDLNEQFSRREAGNERLSFVGRVVVQTSNMNILRRRSISTPELFSFAHD